MTFLFKLCRLLLSLIKEAIMQDRANIDLDEIVPEILRFLAELLGSVNNSRVEYKNGGLSIFVPLESGQIVSSAVTLTSTANFSAWSEAARLRSLLVGLADGEEREVVLTPNLTSVNIRSVNMILRKAGFQTQVWSKKAKIQGHPNKYLFTPEGSAKILVKRKERLPQFDSSHVASGSGGEGVVSEPPERAKVAAETTVPGPVVPESPSVPVSDKVEQAPEDVTTAIDPPSTVTEKRSGLRLSASRPRRGLSLDEISDRLDAGMFVPPVVSKKDRDRLSQPQVLKRRFKPERLQDFSR